MSWGRRWGAVLAAMALAALIGAGSAGAVPKALFASPTGSDSAADCTSQSAPCSLTHALSKASDGDDLTVLPGTYQLTAQLQAPVILYMHGVAGAPRPLIIDKPGAGLFGLSLGAGGGSLRHIAFQGASNGNIGLGYVLDASFATIEDVTVSCANVTQGCLFLRQNVTLRDSSVFVSTTSTNVSAIDDHGQNLAGDVRNVTSVLTGSGAGGVGLIFTNATGSGNLNGTAENVIALGTGAGVEARSSLPGTTALTIDHSNFNGTPIQGAGGTVTVTNRVSATPLLKDIAGGDLHEVAGSPTIDAGIADPANGTVDLDGNPRTIGIGTDVGAYEFAPAPTVSTLAATGVTAAAATLGASVNPNGTQTAVSFVLDSGPGTPRTIPASPLAAGTSVQTVSQTASGLSPNATYTYHVHAANLGGAADGGEAAFQTPPQNTGGGSAPTLTAISLTHHRFRVARASTPTTAAAHRSRAPLGTILRFTVSEPATVTVAIDRILPGRLSKRRCVAPSKRLAHAKSCRRTAAKGALTRSSSAGAHTLAFSGRIGRSALAPGNYVATLSAVDSAGRRSTRHELSFTVVR